MRRWLIGITLAVIAVAASPPARAQVQQGSLTTAAANCGNPPANSTGAIFVAVGSSGGATVTASGTWSGTLSFFGTGDGGVTYTVLTSLNNSNVSTTTGNGTWQFNPTAYSHICVAFTTASSGTAVVTIRLSTNSAGHGGGGGGGSGGTVTSVSCVSGCTVANPTTTPAITITGGGGIGGTLAGNNAVVVDPSANTVGESLFLYDPMGLSAICGNISNNPPCMYTDNGTYSAAFAAQGFGFQNDSTMALTYLTPQTLQIADQATGESTLSFDLGSLTLGEAGAYEGSLTLNDPAGGSGILGMTGGGTYFTISNSLVVGTTTFSPPTFPFTSVEAGQVYVNDALGNITAEFSDLGALMLGANSDVSGSIILNGSGATGASTITVSADGTTVGFDQAVAATEIDQNAAKNFAGTCMMSTSTACTFTAAATFNSTPICIASVQSTTLTGGASSCALSGTTVTITAAVANSLTWAATLIGNPN